MACLATAGACRALPKAPHALGEQTPVGRGRAAFLPPPWVPISPHDAQTPLLPSPKPQPPANHPHHQAPQGLRPRTGAMPPEHGAAPQEGCCGRHRWETTRCPSAQHPGCSPSTLQRTRPARATGAQRRAPRAGSPGRPAAARHARAGPPEPANNNKLVCEPQREKLGEETIFSSTLPQRVL